MKTIVLLTLIFFSFASFAFDKFDVIVCEAQSDDNARINCYKKLDISIDGCVNTAINDELKCYRNIANKEIKTIKSKQKIKLPGVYFVLPETIDVRLGASNNAKVINTLYEGNTVKVIEVKDEWGRISKYYNGEIEGLKGQVARWVTMKQLASNKLKVKLADNNIASKLESVIKSSDSFSKYKQVMLDSSQKLIDQGKCTLADFKEMGGWWRSPNHKPKPVFFIFCGGIHRSNQIYLNAINGSVFR